MFQEFSYYLIFGIPFIVYLGIIALLFFIVTAMISILKRRKIIKVSLLWHFRLAYISLTFGIIHGVLGMLAYV